MLRLSEVKTNACKSNNDNLPLSWTESDNQKGDWLEVNDKKGLTLALLSADQSFLAAPNRWVCRRNSKILPGMETHYRGADKCCNAEADKSISR